MLETKRKITGDRKSHAKWDGSTCELDHSNKDQESRNKVFRWGHNS